MSKRTHKEYSDLESGSPENGRPSKQPRTATTSSRDPTYPNIDPALLSINGSLYQPAVQSSRNVDLSTMHQETDASAHNTQSTFDQLASFIASSTPATLDRSSTLHSNAYHASSSTASGMPATLNPSSTLGSNAVHVSSLATGLLPNPPTQQTVASGRGTATSSVQPNNRSNAISSGYPRMGSAIFPGDKIQHWITLVTTAWAVLKPEFNIWKYGSATGSKPPPVGHVKPGSYDKPPNTSVRQTEVGKIEQFEQDWMSDNELCQAWVALLGSPGAMMERAEFGYIQNDYGNAIVRSLQRKKAHLAVTGPSPLDRSSRVPSRVGHPNARRGLTGVQQPAAAVQSNLNGNIAAPQQQPPTMAPAAIAPAYAVAQTSAPSVTSQTIIPPTATVASTSSNHPTRFDLSANAASTSIPTMPAHDAAAHQGYNDYSQHQFQLGQSTPHIAAAESDGSRTTPPVVATSSYPDGIASNAAQLGPYYDTATTQHGSHASRTAPIEQAVQSIPTMFDEQWHEETVDPAQPRSDGGRVNGRFYPSPPFTDLDYFSFDGDQAYIPAHFTNEHPDGLPVFPEPSTPNWDSTINYQDHMTQSYLPHVGLASDRAYAPPNTEHLTSAEYPWDATLPQEQLGLIQAETLDTFLNWAEYNFPDEEL